MGVRIDIKKSETQTMSVFCQQMEENSFIEVICFNLDPELDKIVQRFHLPKNIFQVERSGRAVLLLNFASELVFEHFLRPEIVDFLRAKAYFLEKDLYYDWLGNMEKIVDIASASISND